MSNNLYQMALHLRERLAAHAANHAEGERDALECVALMDELIKALAPSDEQSLKLVWPTNYRVLTQPFGANPQLYAKWNLPGHEGLDMRAASGSTIYSAASGQVSQVGWRKPKHAYGYAIRLRHSRADGEYETIYAHLQEGSAQVQVGEIVTAHQVIGMADATGNVIPPDARGTHLHFGLKKLGMKNGGYGELIDPMPFFIDAPDW